MAKKKYICPKQVHFPSRRVWVVEEWRLPQEEEAKEEFGYNDWDIYHGA